MTTPTQYRHRIEEIGYQEPSLESLKPTDAQQKLLDLLEVQKNAQEIERALNLDMQVIRSQYQGRLAAASAGSAGRMNLSNKQRVGGRSRVDEQERLNQEMEGKLAPYEEVKKELGELLAKIDIARANLEAVAQGTNPKL